MARRKVIPDGERFGRLVVVEEVEGIVQEKRNILYRCHCDCGRTVGVTADALRSGQQVSCGCKRREQCATLGAIRRERSRKVTIDGESLPISTWAARSGTNRYTIYSRLRYGWSPRDAVYGRSS